jgi:hypothetical protein
MISEILNAAAIPAREGRFPKPPEGTFAVWFDAVESSGPDGQNRIFTHDATVELYAPRTDPEACKAFEAALNERGLQFTSQGWFWLSSIQRYQNIYEFTFIVKT